MKKQIISHLPVRKERTFQKFVKNNYPDILDKIKDFPGKDFSHKFFNFLYDLEDIPLCPICNAQPLKFYGFSYTRTCSPKCGCNHPDHKINYQHSMLEKYGSESFFNTVLFKEKVENTSMRKHGTTHHLSSKEVKNKIKQNNLDKYGVENVSQIPEVKIKRNKTLHDNGFMFDDKYTKKWLDKIKKTHIENGSWFDFNDLRLQEEFKKYKRRVRYLTEKINLEKLLGIQSKNRKQNKIHIDHIYSIGEGFRNNIPPEIIADPNNLQLLSEKDNISKGMRSDISIEQLYLLIGK